MKKKGVRPGEGRFVYVILDPARRGKLKEWAKRKRDATLVRHTMNSEASRLLAEAIDSLNLKGGTSWR
jgi:hypothetical protein